MAAKNSGQPRLDLKSSCCEKYLRKAKACKRCPVMALLSKKKRRKRLKKVRKRLNRSSR